MLVFPFPPPYPLQKKGLCVCACVHTVAVPTRWRICCKCLAIATQMGESRCQLAEEVFLISLAAPWEVLVYKLEPVPQSLFISTGLASLPIQLKEWGKRGTKG